MPHSRFIFAPAAMALLLATPLAAQDKDDLGTPAVYRDVVECTGIADPTERLACFDRSVAKLRDARENKEIVLADKEQIREAKRGLFGITLPTIKLFSNDKDDEVQEITDTVKSYRFDASGRAIITLASGSRWQQVDTKRARIADGRSIRIRRAALGSYFANIGEATAIRVRRIVD